VRDDRGSRLLKILDGTEMEKFDFSALRGLKDPFEILVTIVLGLKVTDEKCTEARIKLFDSNPKILRRGRPLVKEAVQEIIRPLGMEKSRYLSILSIHDFFDRKVPTTFGELSKIHGVGPKTAALYLDVAFGKPSVCVDVHCARVLNRIGYEGDPKILQLDLMTDLPKERWNEVNPKLISHGKDLCGPKPDCGRCFLKCVRI